MSCLGCFLSDLKSYHKVFNSRFCRNIIGIDIEINIQKSDIRLQLTIM